MVQITEYPDVNTAVSDEIHNTQHAPVSNTNFQPDLQNQDTHNEQTSLLQDLRDAEGVKKFIVFKSNTYGNQTEFAKMYPSLYPWGRGTLAEVRKVPIGMHEYIKNMMRLSTKQFLMHMEFMLNGFDVLAKQAATQSLHHKIIVNPERVRNIGNIEEKDIIEYLKYNAQTVYNASNGRQSFQPPEHLKSIFSAQKLVELSQGKFWASNEERGQARKDLMAKVQANGMPHLFFTLTPDVNGTLAVAIKSGLVHPNVLNDLTTNVNDAIAQIPTLQQRKTYNSQTPFLCAEYFHNAVQITVKHIFGWSEKTNSSYPEGGIFGHVKDWFLSVESQKSFMLHGHFVLWLHELPTSYKEFHHKMTLDEAYNAKYIEWASSIKSSSLCLPESYRNRCPDCGTKLTSIPASKEAFQKPKSKTQGPPILAECTGCGRKFSSITLCRAYILKYALKHDISSALYTNEVVEAYMLSSENITNDFSNVRT
jgi:hypothetical protein